MGRLIDDLDTDTVSVPFESGSGEAVICISSMSMWIEPDHGVYTRPCVMVGSGRFVQLTHEQFREFVIRCVPFHVNRSVNGSRMLIHLEHDCGGHDVIHMWPPPAR
jgi:hypothetical protein